VIRFETREEIDRSIGDIWAYAADIARHPEWMGVTEARLTHGDGTTVGARATERIRMGPKVFDVDLEVSRADPPHRIGWRIAGRGPLSGEVTLDLEPIGADRTRATWSGRLGLTGIWWVLEPVLAAEIRAGEATELRRLKTRMETTASTAVPA